jgi:tetrahydromethanopterin S-methyltransferase subunit G
MAILRTVKRFLQRAQGWLERRAFAQLHGRLDALDRRLETMSTLERRLGEVQATVETTAARAAASIEYSHGAAESEARVTRRIEAIEQMLGAKPQADA